MSSLLAARKGSGIFTVPNALSLLRLLAFGPAAYFASLGTRAGNLRAAALLLFMALTDICDGYLARRLNQRSEFGRIIDPVADKICVGGLFLILAWRRELPWWLVGLVLGRDLLILGAGLFMLGRFQRVTESNWFGKIAVAVLIATLLVYLFDLRVLREAALGASVVAIAVSSSAYAVRFVRVLRGEEELPPPAKAPSDARVQDAVSVPTE